MHECPLRAHLYVRILTYPQGKGAMKTHQIDVDDEVMGFLKAKADAFVDTPNSVLRRILLGEGPDSSPRPAHRKAASLVPDVGRGLPKALEQVLQVAHLTRYESFDRVAATHEVARHHGVAFQTVLDKYARQLDLTADAFDRLLGQEDLRELRDLLLKRFPRFRSRIEIMEPSRSPR